MLALIECVSLRIRGRVIRYPAQSPLVERQRAKLTRERRRRHDKRAGKNDNGRAGHPGGRRSGRCRVQALRLADLPFAVVTWATFGAKVPLTPAFFAVALVGLEVTFAVRTGIASPVSSQYLTRIASPIRV